MTKTEKIVALAVLGWVVFKPKPATTTTSSPPRPSPPTPPADKPKPIARIYQGPDDSYETVRMSVETPGMPAKEMGIFSSRAMAESVAKGYGWTVLP